jgi:MerR family transcriptional regulator, copper efflux regulator
MANDPAPEPGTRAGDPAEPTIHIGELAERTGLSLRTIRHYDEIRLVQASGRTDGGFRLYTQHDLDRLLLIRRMKPLGFSLEEMADLLGAVDGLQQADDEQAPQLTARLEHHLNAAEQRRLALVRQLEQADEFIGMLRDHLGTTAG